MVVVVAEAVILTAVASYIPNYLNMRYGFIIILELDKSIEFCFKPTMLEATLAEFSLFTERLSRMSFLSSNVI